MIKNVINFQIVLVHLFGLFYMLYVPNLVESIEYISYRQTFCTYRQTGPKT